MSRSHRPSLVTLPPWAGPAPSLLDFFDHRFPRVGREVWRRRFQRGLVQDETGEPIHLAAPYRPGVRLRYFREVESEPSIPLPETVLWQDDHLLAVDKPPYLPVHPGGAYVNECLLHRLERRLGEGELAPLHRLDLATSGLMLFSRRPESRGAYVDLFRQRRIAKEYLAVARLPAELEGTLWTRRSRLVKGEPWFRMREAEGEANAETRVELLERRGDLGLFRLRPTSGRQHQLRVHMAALGMPILHDRYYPQLTPERPPDLARPLQLLAWRLSFADPLDGSLRRFESRLGLAAWGGRISAS